ncbi:NEW3 domain-containing protein, partial [Thermodesulfobacteriota bacterium]
GLKRAKDAFEFAKSEFDRNKLLFEEGHISREKFNQVQKRFTDAEVSYQQMMLSILFENQYITISSAMKYSSDSGDNIVRITIDNTSSGGAELKKLVSFDEDLFKALEPGVINNVYVSIINDEGAIISQPYEHKIERLPPNKPEELSFMLLQDLDIVTVRLMYSDGTTDRKKIYLQKDSSINKVEVQSEQFSQEVELGNSASYDLSLELFSGTSDTFKLEVVNLPNQINRYFVNRGTDTRLSYFKFTESTSTKRASLKVFLPDRASESIIMGQSIKFYVLAIPQNRVKEIKLDNSKQWTEEEIINLNVGYAKLDLVPRGIGELLVKAQQLFFSIKPDETVEIPIELVNNGTRSLNNVEIDVVDEPLNWDHSIEPKNIDTLKVSEEKRAVIKIIPSDDVSPGRYPVRIATTSLSDDLLIAGEDKSITVEIKAETNLIGMIIILLLILGLVGGMVIFGIRLSRR